MGLNYFLEAVQIRYSDFKKNVIMGNNEEKC